MSNLDPQLSKPRILVVGAHEDTVRVTRMVFEHFGLVVVGTALAIDKALAIARAGEPAFDLLFSTSRVYGDGDARDMLRALRRDGWTGPAILTTANAFEEDIVADCRDAGFAAVLPKPSSAEAMLAAIRDCATPSSIP